MSIEVRQELVEDLLNAVIKELTTRMKRTPTGAELSTARRFLGDQGVSLMATSEAERRLLASIRKLYLQRLKEALEGERPSAAVFAEVFRFMNAAGIVDGIGSYVGARKALQTLTAADLPFQ